MAIQNILGNQFLPTNDPISTGVMYASGTFKTNCNPVYTTNVAAYNATSGSTISGTDWITGLITVNPSANQTITSPSGSDIVTAFTSLFGAPVAGQAFRLKYWNQSSFTSTITAGSGITFSRGNTSTIIPAQGDVDFVCFFNSGSTLIMFGN